MQSPGASSFITQYIKEVGYDANLTTILDCIQMASELSKGRPMIQLKVTALMPAELLITLSKMYTYGGISIEQVAEAMYTPSLLYEVEGLPEAEIRQWCRGLERLREAGEFAQRKGVYILVDAEYTHMNPGISLAALAMMLNFNKDIPLIWNTYQCYLKEAYNAITADYATIMDKGLCFGAKIVRGAYINCEEEYAKRQGVPNPVCDSYKDTSSSYNRVVETMLHNISHCGEKCNIIVASHNEESVRKAIQGMEKLGIARDSGLVYFGQLLGMCDQVSYPLGQAGYQIYKSLPYGTVEETLPYLSRRAQENKSVLMGARKERSLLQRELRRRFLRF
ncbi:hydroxyproline dehydrogenase isoform X2 [Lingula anatina]|uniref:Proline dehydrogenase n=1 Tax=Lingula anatina TaxID=7574 RepID=A0A1S3KET2_LINAN|nr:hydroxyproline dehydrogenase isoform X2 [Lingula anatina]|eukprot:XP_013420751.1 hydroxyproline dehydrogenase isoform X2 [Lingula anatina]